MKRFILCLVLLLGACTTTQQNVQQSPTYVETHGSYSRYNCNTCSTSYTVSKPVEVIYKDTTYTTVYEPKTYSSTSYSRKPYDSCTKAELCD